MRTDARVLTATSILFLPPAAHAVCLTGWTPSSASATCFLVPPERSTSFFRCVDLCEEYGGTPGGLDCLMTVCLPFRFFCVV